MKAGEFQSYFLEQLTPFYESREIRNMFFLVCEELFGISRTGFFTEPNRDFSADDLKKVRAVIAKLKKYKPLQYIFGKTTFCGLEFKLSPSVLIPRPETEELADFVLSQHSEQCEKGRQINILDIGTGSGCLAISLAKLLPGSIVKACDFLLYFLSIARQNAEYHRVEIGFQKCDILSSFPRPSKFKYDIILSNPPYVRLSEQSLMQPNVLEWEPAEALFVSDEDPLVFYREIATKAKERLNDGGKLYFEINEATGPEIQDLLEEIGYQQITVWNDIHGKDRFVMAG